MSIDRSTLIELRRLEADAKKEWERAVHAVRAANEEVSRAHRKYLQASNALQDALTNPDGKTNDATWRESDSCEGELDGAQGSRLRVSTKQFEGRI
jgi:hypothetical protein